MDRQDNNLNNNNTFNSWIGLGKAIVQLIAIILYVGIVAPHALNQATEVGTMTTLPIGIACLLALLPYAFGVWFAFTCWLASCLESQWGGYGVIGCVYGVLAWWSGRMVDYRQWTLYETSLMSGLYEQ